MFLHNLKKRVKVLSVILTAIFVLSALPIAFIPTLAATQVVNGVADPSTSAIENKFTMITADDGKVAADKTVNYKSDEFDAFNSYEDDEFSVELSALAQSYVITEIEERTEYEKYHADVVFILDVSGSMGRYNMAGSTTTRAEGMATAVNSAINRLMEADPETRFGIVSYGYGYYGTSGVYLPIDNYTLQEGDTNYVLFAQDTTTATIKIPDATAITSGVAPYDSFTYLYFDGSESSQINDTTKVRLRVSSDGSCSFYTANSTTPYNFTIDNNSYKTETLSGTEYAVLRVGNKYTLYSNLQYTTGQTTTQVEHTKTMSNITTSSNSKTSVTLDNNVNFRAYRSSTSNSASIYVYRGTNTTRRATLTSSAPTATYTYNNVTYTFTRTSSSSMTITYYTTETTTGQVLKTTNLTVPTTTSGTAKRISTSSLLKNSNGTTMTSTGYTVNNDGTFTQAGLKAAENMFESVTDTENRIPVIVLISDGTPTFYDVDYENVPHMNDVASSTGGDGISKKGGNGSVNNCTNQMGYLTIRTAMSVKNAVNEKYNENEENIQDKALFYSIGPGVDYLFGQTVLDPSPEHIESCQDNTTTNEQSGNGTPDGLRTMLLNNLTEEELEYVDFADWSLTGNISTSEMESGFKKIVAAITDIPRPVTTTEITTYDGQVLGDNAYVTFTDTLGDGMELRGAPVIRYGNKNYTATSSSTANITGGVKKTTFIYNYSVEEASTGIMCSLSKMLVYLFEEADGKQTLISYIPSNLLPTITPDLEITGVYNAVNPIRIISKVGVRNADEAKGVYYTNDINSPATFGFTPIVGNPYYYNIYEGTDGLMHADWDYYNESEIAKTSNPTNSLYYSLNEEIGTAEAGTVERGVSVSLGNNGRIEFRYLEINPDAVVIDYGLPVNIQVLGNDHFIVDPTGINSIGTTEPSQLGTEYTTSQFSKKSSLSLENGNARISDDGQTVIYTPTNATMSDEEVFYYEVISDGKYYYQKITVIPAANIYYEDSFFTFTNGTGYNWETAGATYEDAFQAEDRPGTEAPEDCDANNNYGRDSVYNDESVTYSLGSAMKATVDADSVGKEPKASFIFCGTGFDLFSVTTNKSGMALINVKSLTSGITYNKTYAINTYYGYSYGRLYVDADGNLSLAENGNEPLYETNYRPGIINTAEGERVVKANGNIYSNKPYLFTEGDSNSYRYAYGWLLSSGNTVAENGLYQIPVVSIPSAAGSGVQISELEYGTYQVTVTPKYSASLDKTGCGEYTFCIDGIRIYNPAGTGNDISDTVAAAYEADMESNPQYVEVRDSIIADGESFLKQTMDDTGKTVGGALFLDGITALNSDIKSSLDKYKETGPNNEVYLSDGQALAFKPQITDCLSAPASFQLGMKVMREGETDRGNATVKIIVSDENSSLIKSVYSFDISGSAEQWYDLTNRINWTHEGNNSYISTYSIVILNDSDSVVSLTSFKWTYLSNEVAPQPANAPMLSFASAASTLDFADDAIMSVYGTVDTTDIKLSWLNTRVQEGATARLIVTTSKDITSVSVGDVELTDFTDYDGIRVWNYDFTAKEIGRNTLEVTFTDSRGRTVSTVTTQALTVTQETEETTGQIEDGSKISSETENDSENFVEYLYNLLKALLDLIKSLLSWG